MGCPPSRHKKFDAQCNSLWLEQQQIGSHAKLEQFVKAVAPFDKLPLKLA
jgi:hypothetical protein